MLPVLNAPPFAVAVCVVPAALCQETVCPTVTVSGFGENEFAPFSATIVIVLSAAPPPLPGPVGFLSLLLQLRPTTAISASTERIPRKRGSRRNGHLPGS